MELVSRYEISKFTVNFIGFVFIVVLNKNQKKIPTIISIRKMKNSLGFVALCKCSVDLISPRFFFQNSNKLTAKTTTTRRKKIILHSEQLPENAERTNQA